MTTIKRFEDMKAWQKARELTSLVYQLTSEGSWARDFGLREQIRRAAVSVMSNVAEGFERRGDVEFARFLTMAKGSAGEVRSQLYVALDLAYVDERDFARARTLAEETSGMIAALMRYLRSGVRNQDGAASRASTGG